MKIKQVIDAAVAAGEIAADATDAQVHAWLTGPDQTEQVWQRRTCADVRSYLLKQSDVSLAVIRDAATDHADAGVRELATRAWLILSERNAEIWFDDDAERGAFDQALANLAAAGLLGNDTDPATNPHRAAIMALGVEDQPRWRARGLGREPTERDVHVARGGA